MGVSPNYMYQFRGANNKDYTTLGSILRLSGSGLRARFPGRKKVHSCRVVLYKPKSYLKTGSFIPY